MHKTLKIIIYEHKADKSLSFIYPSYNSDRGNKKYVQNLMVKPVGKPRRNKADLMETR